MKTSTRICLVLLTLRLLPAGIGSPEVHAASEVLVGPGSTVTYIANSASPGLGTTWTADDFDDSGWNPGWFGIGYETSLSGVLQMISTTVPQGTVSVYARARFELPAVPIQNLHLGLDFDDGVAAWINGIEVYRSPQMPAGALDWHTPAGDHESSNDSSPYFYPLLNISDTGLDALHQGENVLAVAVWNTGAQSSDLLLVPRLSVNETMELVRGPYLQNATQSTLTLRWRTNLPVSGRVTYGSAPDDLSLSREEPTPKTDHSIELTNLAPDARYYYAVGDELRVLAGGDDEHSFVTPPARGSSKPTRIWVLGDSGTGGDGARAVRDAYYALSQGRRTDLWLMLGDNAYPDGTDGNYQTGLFNVFGQMLRESVLWPALGNHDTVRANNQTQTGPYFDIFDLPTGPHPGGAASGTEAYYSFDFANVHFVALDSNTSDRSGDGPMATWLAADLAANAQDWLIAYWHHPPYSRGSHDSDAEIPLIEMRENLVPLLEDHGVDLILTAHSHSYERSHLMDGHYGASDTFDETMNLDAGDGDLSGDGAYAKAETGPEPHSGAVFTVAGSSGKITGGSLDHPAMARSLNVLGSVILDIDGGRLKARFLDDQGLVRDSYTMIKGCADPNQRFASRVDPAGPGSAVYTPGLCDDGPPCLAGSSVSPSLTGSFWRLGDGDPAVGPGVDNGSFPALEPGDTGWLLAAAGTPASIESSWAHDGRIDGCLAADPGPRCMGIMLADQDQGVGYFAVLTDQEDAAGDFSFAQDADEPIALAEIPRPLILASQVVNATQVVATVAPGLLTGGRYLDDACPAGPIVGYKLYEQRTARGAQLPLDRTREGGTDDGAWALATGGAGAEGAPLPLGSTASVTFTCLTAVDIALGAALVLDSGFETPVVSVDSSRILCSDCEMDNDLDGFCGRFLEGIGGPDCDDDLAEVYPDAPQACGDWINNDCRHPNWPRLSGTNESDDDDDGFTECDGDCRDDVAEIWGVPSETGLLEFGTDGRSFVWNIPDDFGGLEVAYDILRSNDPSDFGPYASCIDADQGLPFAIDFNIPEEGAAYYYLVRAENACGGRLGQDSNGTPRVARSCP